MEDLISKLLELTHHIWTTRNGILHEKDQDSLTALESQQLREDIEEQLLLGAETLKPDDKHLLEGSPETLQQASLTTKRIGSERYTSQGRLLRKNAKMTSRACKP